jgi:hypothetical protein
VSETLQGNFLRLADRSWCARVAAGVDWMLWAGVGVVLTNLLTLAYTLRIPVALLGLVMQLAGYYGVWLCATPEPDRFETGASLRRWARIGAGGWLALRAGGWLLTASPTGSFAVGYPAACVGLATDVVVLVMLRRLATRIPDERLAQRFTIVTWFYALGAAAMLMPGLLSWLCYLLGVTSSMANVFARATVLYMFGLMLLLSTARLLVLYAASRALGAVVEAAPEAKTE